MRIAKNFMAVAFAAAAGFAGTFAMADSCFWMSTDSGNPWVPAPQGDVDKDKCFALDSCDGGKGESGGGCYKWAASADAPREPWYSCFWLDNQTNEWVPAPQGMVSEGQCQALDSCQTGGGGQSGGGCYKWTVSATDPQNQWD
ncbi:hypothetical protein JMM63_17610 [Rhodovulum sulfidophilum]|uniref:Secreted protein n=1 Tax=Rhodovulum sulfidophilum TaxID=35806 RepID=A0ABS1RYT7_RHOSU|nr:hypothetical protein [Rhodovulum sulfidophilum]MBL3597356.1 hypothetical protein [Rhodovulum sulfidophilum]MBL3611260.1 hypothetical protein [Rhodovulum sulfidophilum]MCE8420787.1 hypothetical protein [Rhodovulum sulfidophilum]MCE8457966.1 hypothetical protein [Rhodovulum sulfidophilum]MCE8468248.1 hypothetical protein [Rhodovulum sulfidophilum]